MKIKLHRKMADPKFRKQQWGKRYSSHIKLINQLVDELKLENLGKVPYVDPSYGGVNANVLFLFQDPGPKTDNLNGSGFLSAENDDPSAELFAQCLDQVGLKLSQVITWNAYPWSLRNGDKIRIKLGIEPLFKLLTNLKKLKVIITMGKVASISWQRFIKIYPNTANKYFIMSGLHTSNRGITNGGHHSKKEGINKNLLIMKKALYYIRK